MLSIILGLLRFILDREVNFGDIEYHSGASEFHFEWWRLILEMLSIILGLLRFILDGGG